MKKLVNEFKEFAFRGNVLDMAVGVMIGGAIGNIVTALIDNVIMPIVNIFTGKVDFSELTFSIGNSVVKYGVLITAVVNFLIMALCIFAILKLIVKFKKPEEKHEPRRCPYCFSEIHDEATRCPHCTSPLPKEDK